MFLSEQRLTVTTESLVEMGVMEHLAKEELAETVSTELQPESKDRIVKTSVDQIEVRKIIWRNRRKLISLKIIENEEEVKKKLGIEK